MMRITVLVAAMVLGAGAPSMAQAPQPPAEPTTPARMQVGPVSVRPSLILRDVGYDSNVFNRADGEEGDFTATLGAKVDVGFRSSLVQATYTSFFEYLYFQNFDSERGSNRGTDGRVDFLFGRVRPFVTAGISRSHERPNAEIDERALRLLSNLGGGTTVALFSRTALSVSYRRTEVNYADDELFRGVRLADQLDGTAEAVTGGVDVRLSPLTTLSVHGEKSQERFDFSPGRDSDSYRYGVTAHFQPLALISGRATVGMRAFRPHSANVREFTGMTAAVALAYAYRDETRVGVTIDRDLRYSFAETTPYYISTGGRVTLTHRLFGNIDGQVLGGLERIAYEARLDAVDSVDGTDTVRTAGAGVGYRLGDGSRLGLNFDVARRTSPAPDREYRRGRLYATLTYGF